MCTELPTFTVEVCRCRMNPSSARMAPGSSGSPKSMSRHEREICRGRRRHTSVSGTSTIGFLSLSCARCSSTSAGNGSGRSTIADPSVRGRRRNTSALWPCRAASTTPATALSPFDPGGAWICLPPRYQRANGEKMRYPSPVAARATGRPSRQKVKLKYSKWSSDELRST